MTQRLCAVSLFVVLLGGIAGGVPPTDPATPVNIVTPRPVKALPPSADVLTLGQEVHALRVEVERLDRAGLLHARLTQIRRGR